MSTYAAPRSAHQSLGDPFCIAGLGGSYRPTPLRLLLKVRDQKVSRVLKKSGPEHLRSVPTKDSQVAWYVEVAAWNQKAQTGNGSYAVLRVTFSETAYGGTAVTRISAFRA